MNRDETNKSQHPTIREGLRLAGYTEANVDRVLTDLDQQIVGNAFLRLVSEMPEADRAALNQAITSVKADQQQEIIAKKLAEHYPAMSIEQAMKQTAKEEFRKYFQFLISNTAQDKQQQLSRFCAEAGLV